MKKKAELLYTKFLVLEKRIVTHRRKCERWKNGKSCYNCHKNTLTPIERTIREIIIET